jgi:hypothetical protein
VRRELVEPSAERRASDSVARAARVAHLNHARQRSEGREARSGVRRPLASA